jgi:hypothetical protein
MGTYFSRGSDATNVEDPEIRKYRIRKAEIAYEKAQAIEAAYTVALLIVLLFTFVLLLAKMGYLMP